MPGACAKMPRGVLRMWPLMAVVYLALVAVCRAEITSNETPLDVFMDEEERNDVSIEDLRSAIVDEILEDLVRQVLRIYREREAVYNGLTNIPSKRVTPFKFGGNGLLANSASGFQKKSADDDQDLWAPYAEDKRGRTRFNSRLTNLASGFTKKSIGDDEGEGLQEGEDVDKRARTAFNSRLTNLASGFTKRSDEEAGLYENKRARSSFTGARRLTNLQSGFKRGENEEDLKDKRGRTSFMGARRLTNLGSGFNKRGGGKTFNAGPMVNLASGFTGKRDS